MLPEMWREWGFELLCLSAMSFMKPNKWFMYNIPDLPGEEKDPCVWLLFTLSPKASGGFSFIFEQMRRVDGWIRGESASRQERQQCSSSRFWRQIAEIPNLSQSKINSVPNNLSYAAAFWESAVDGEHQGPKASKIQ